MEAPKENLPCSLSILACGNNSHLSFLYHLAFFLVFLPLWNPSVIIGSPCVDHPRKSQNTLSTLVKSPSSWSRDIFHPPNIPIIFSQGQSRCRKTWLDPWGALEGKRKGQQERLYSRKGRDSDKSKWPLWLNPVQGQLDVSIRPVCPKANEQRLGSSDVNKGFGVEGSCAFYLLCP